MRLAFCIVTWFAHGGLQRDMAAIARDLVARGHQVTLFAERAFAPPPEGLELKLLPTGAWANHRRNALFAAAFNRATRDEFERTVAFGALPGADIVYCADPSFIVRHPHWWQRLGARYRTMARLERTVFGPDSRTLVLALAQPQIEGYRRVHGTPPERLVLLPPGLDPGVRQPANRRDGTRQAVRRDLGIAQDTRLLLWVGAQPRVKGLDRVLTALAAFPSRPPITLAIAGLPDGHPPRRRVDRHVQRQGLGDRVLQLGVRRDIPRLMAGADLLVHPARLDTTGTVILEALANGLPVITTDVCGFAPHVTLSGAGAVVQGDPFDAPGFAAALAELVGRDDPSALSEAAERYAGDPGFYTGRTVAADIIAAPDPRKQR